MDVELATSRLWLRQPVPGDARRLATLLDNFRVAGNLARVPYPYALSDAESWLAGWRRDSPAGETGFVVDLAGEGLIGHCGLNRSGAVVMLGYWLGEPYWNRGFMTEAARAVLDWYFEASGSAAVCSGIFAFNRASLTVQTKLGFTQTGISSVHCLARNQELRHIDTELTRARWAAGRVAASTEA